MAENADLSAVISVSVSKVTLLRYRSWDEPVLLSDCPPPGTNAPGTPVVSVMSREDTSHRSWHQAPMARITQRYDDTRESARHTGAHERAGAGSGNVPARAA